MKARAFTLIELLVVIAIIAILAAILFPVFAQAKAAAKKSSDLSNHKQLALGMFTYSSDFDDVFPSAYYHVSFNDAAPSGTKGGYIHWSYMIQPYVKNWQIFVSPGDKIGGHAPTCFDTTSNNQGAGFPSGQGTAPCTAYPGSQIVNGRVQDYQAPRLSYTVNSAVIPRLRNQFDLAAGIRTVSQTSLDSVSSTIMIAGLVDNLSCLNGESSGTPARNSSHRSTNAFTKDVANTVQYLGERSDGLGAYNGPVYALNFGQVTTANYLKSCRTTTGTAYPLIVYHSWDRWNDGDNYGMADGSAKFRKFNQTLNPESYNWGKAVYTDGGRPVLNPLTGQQVNQ